MNLISNNEAVQERIAAAHMRWEASDPITGALAEAICDILDQNMAHVESCEELTDLILERVSALTKVAEVGLYTICEKAGRPNV